MFFSSRTIEALIEDHIKLKGTIFTLDDNTLPIEERRRAFERLIPDLISHTKREESVIYSFMKASKNKLLGAMAIEGEEEHAIVDGLVKDLRSSNITPELWTAKAKVITRLIENHVRKEEKEVFPALKKILNSDSDLDMCNRYEALDREYNIPIGVSTQTPPFSSYL